MAPFQTVDAAAPFTSRRRWTQATLWIALLALAGFIRAGAIRSDLPYLGYVDEGHVLHQVVNLLQGRTLDTGFYNYPSLPSYLVAGAVLAYAPVHQVLHGHSFWDEFQNNGQSIAHYYDFLAPPEFIVCGRAVTILFSIGTVILAGMLGTRLGGWRVGVLALLFTSLCPALVSRGAIVIVDTFSTFFALATLLLCQRLQKENTVAAAWRYALGAGVMAGFAFTSKYTVGAVFLAVLFTIALLPATMKIRALLAALAGIGLVVGSVLTMPLLITQFARIVETIRGIADFYNTVPSNPGYWGAALSRDELGIPLVATGLAGIGLMLSRQRETRTVALAWLAFAILLIGALVRSNFQPLRNLLPLVPLVCIGAAFFLVRAHEYLSFRAGHLVGRGLALVAVLSVAISLALPAWKHLRERTSHVDTRVTAIDWLQQNTTAHDRILVIEELAILPSEWKRISAQAVLVSWPGAVQKLAAEQFDYVVASEFELRFVGDAPGPARYAKRWAEAVSPLPMAAAFGHMPNLIVPGVWRSNDERIIILRGKAEEPVTPASAPASFPEARP